MIEQLDITKGGVYHLDRGTFELKTDGPLKPNNYLTIRGSGMGLTKIYGDLDLLGTDKVMFNLFELSGFTLFGSVNMDRCFAGSMERVTIREPASGTCVRMRESYDNHFSFVHFIRATHGLIMQDAVNTGTVKNGNCNNNTFLNCRWENNVGDSLIMGLGATKNRLIGCKWHGLLPTPSPTGDHIVMYGCYDNMLHGFNITNGGRSGIVMRNHGQWPCRDNSIFGHIGNCRGWGIDGVLGNKINVVWSSVYGANRLGNSRGIEVEA
jgi:hypothetical protein